MIQFSKVWCGFTVVATILVLIFITGLLGLSAQTTQDGVVAKDKSSNDTAKREGLFGSGISLEDLSNIGGFLVGIVAVVSIIIFRKQPPIQVLLPTSEDIHKSIKGEQSNESSRVEKAVQNVERNPKASFVDKTTASAYRLQQSKNIDEALQMWCKIVDYAEGNDDNLAARAWFSIGYLHIDGSVGEKMPSANDLALHLQLDSPEVYINPNAIAEAFSSYSEAIRLKPDYAEAYCKRGTVKLYLGEYESALDDYDAAIRLKPDYPSAYYNRGNANIAIGKYEAAVDDYDAAIRLKPDYPEAYIHRGNANIAMGEYEAAFDDCNEAICLKPDYPEAYIHRGIAQAGLGHDALALHDYDKAIRLKPDYSEAYYGRGLAKVNLGNIENAREDFRIALELAEQQGKENYKVYMEEELQRLGVFKGLEGEQ